MRIYVASSWRNQHQPRVVQVLRELGHVVYDFRHPAVGVSGFSWAEIDPNWKSWTPAQYREALEHAIAKRGYTYDEDALLWADTCVMVLPSGRSASWELGFMMGKGKQGFVYMPEPCEPELMYLRAQIIVTEGELRAAFRC
jgi:hypothetical protein